jgi:hypothetical protein
MVPFIGGTYGCNATADKICLGEQILKSISVENRLRVPLVVGQDRK